MRGFIIRGGLGLTSTPGGVTVGGGDDTGGFVFTPSTQNTDSSPITAGEITGYQVGIRASNGTPGVYTIFLSIDDPNNASQLIADIQPPLNSGDYVAAVRSIGPVNSGWSNESAFTV